MQARSRARRSILMFLAFIGSVTIAGAPRHPDSVFVRSDADTVGLWNVRVEENCATRFRSTITVSQDTVKWVQTDTVGHLVNCLCRYDLRASVTGLPPGSYLALVLREQLQQYGYERDTLISIGSVAFAVLLPGGAFSSASLQSACHSLDVLDPEDPGMPTAFTLGSFPNPFNPVTTISYTLPASSHVRLEVYDPVGEQIETLIDRDKGAGTHTVQWHPHVASGVYYCRLRATALAGSGMVVRSLKLVLIK